MQITGGNNPETATLSIDTESNTNLTISGYSTGEVEQIEEDIKKHLSAEKFQKPTHYEGNRIQETIEELRQLKTICDEDINVLLDKPSFKCTFSEYRSWAIINFILVFIIFFPNLYI